MAHGAVQAGLEELFDKEGFCCREIAFVDKVVENRLRQLQMDRRWIQAVFATNSAGVRPSLHLALYAHVVAQEYPQVALPQQS